jgi:hypothetical protein
MFIKAGVVVSSLLLFGGFVSYRAGALNSLLAPNENAAVSGSGVVAEETAPDSSKSDTLTFPLSDTLSAQPPAPSVLWPPATTQPTLMYSSKAAYTLSVTLPDKPATQPPATNPKKESSP